MTSFLDWFEGDRRLIPFFGRPRTSLVRDHNPFDDGTDALRAPIATMALASPKTAASGSTACGANPERTQRLLTTFWNARRKRRWMSRPGWNGFLAWPCRALDGRRKLGRGFRQSAFLDRIKDVSETTSAVVGQLSARGFEGKLTTSKYAAARQMLPGHGTSRHP